MRPTVAQLSVVVPPPTLHVTVVEDSAGMRMTSRHRNSRAARAEVNRCGSCHSRRAGVGSSTISHLSIVIGSPTLQFAVVKNGAGMEVSGRYRNGGAARTEVRRLWDISIRPHSVAQLSEIAIPPALQVTVVKDGACVPGSNSHRDGRAARAEVDRSG